MNRVSFSSKSFHFLWIKRVLLSVFAIFFSLVTFSQELTQTVRGTVIDNDSKMPLPGVTVVIVGTNPTIATTTNALGNFKFEGIRIGRIAIQFSLMSFETLTMPNIEVFSGKEVMLEIVMQEKVLKLDEVVIKQTKNKGEATNDMSLVSARSISTEESKRYSGGFDDPARVVANYAGVANTADASSDIIVRGNAPKYIQWRLEGVEITSPYHFDDQNSSFGALSALNNNLLSTSDFYTGAFSPEYGNVLSSVFDVKLRAGNNEKFEGTIAAGIMGTDITLEGPLKKGYGGSYIINYRYSTASLISDLGLIDVPGLFNYQDACAKIVLPTKKIGTFSIFGFGGLDDFSVKDLRPSLIATPSNKYLEANESEDWNKNNFLLNAGLNHTFTINSNSYIKTTLAFSGNGISDKIYKNTNLKILDSNGLFISDSIISRTQNFDNRLEKSVYRGATTYSNKFNEKNKIQIGVKYNLFAYNFEQSNWNAAGTMNKTIDFNENVSTIQSFASWQYRWNDNLTFVSGLHNMNVLYNKKSTIEPRIAANWKMNETNSIHIGYGNHSTMEVIQHYFTRIHMPDGSIVEPNKQLDLLKANHYVVGYEKRFTKNLMAKVELYYQHLYNLPVENYDTSYFATINEGLDYSYVALTNKGTGKNYGIEITLERFFDNNYYFLVNTTLFQSKYKSLEGIERNTQFNQNYLCNILVGKEFRNLGKTKNRTLALNGKIIMQGGRKIIPLLRDGNGHIAIDPTNNRYWDYSKAYNNSLDNIFQLNISVSYKINRKNTTHEIFLDLQNITNNEARLNEYYDASQPSQVGNLKQMFFVPNLMYRVYF